MSNNPLFDGLKARTIFVAPTGFGVCFFVPAAGCESHERGDLASAPRHKAFRSAQYQELLAQAQAPAENLIDFAKTGAPPARPRFQVVGGRDA